MTRRMLSNAFASRQGFTLIEVLLVVSVLAVIAGVVVPQVTSVVDDARHSAMLVDLREITMAIERYRMEHQGGPPDLIQNETLVQLVGKTDFNNKNEKAGALAFLLTLMIVCSTSSTTSAGGSEELL